MKRWLPYSFILIAVILLGFLIVASLKKQPRQLNEKISLRQHDKIPYGTAATKKLMSHVFPGVPVYYNRKAPGEWDSVNSWKPNQALFLVADRFLADEEELEYIIEFAGEGNYVFILAKSFSYETLVLCGFDYNSSSMDLMFGTEADSLRIRLEPPFFRNQAEYIYPGIKHEAYFTKLDTAKAIVLGRTENGRPNFIQMNTGKGKVFIHTAPLAFSNYFVLHKSNHEYFEHAVSVIPPGVEKILWNEYFLVKPRTQNEKDPNWLRILMQYPSFKWGLLLGILTLFLYVLLNMRRRQRMIPERVKPKNESLDFVKTLGRLYYQRKDHVNLARKMSTHFLDHVRSRYKIGTVTLDKEFVTKLHFKSGYPENNIGQLVEFINFLENAPAISEGQLASFHLNLESFYQKT